MGKNSDSSDKDIEEQSKNKEFSIINDCCVNDDSSMNASKIIPCCKNDSSSDDDRPLILLKRNNDCATTKSKSRKYSFDDDAESNIWNSDDNEPVLNLRKRKISEDLTHHFNDTSFIDMDMDLSENESSCAHENKLITKPTNSSGNDSQDTRNLVSSNDACSEDAQKDTSNNGEESLKSAANMNNFDVGSYNNNDSLKDDNSSLNFGNANEENKAKNYGYAPKTESDKIDPQVCLREGAMAVVKDNMRNSETKEEGDSASNPTMAASKKKKQNIVTKDEVVSVEKKREAARKGKEAKKEKKREAAREGKEAKKVKKRESTKKVR